MSDPSRTKSELIKETSALKKRIKELERSETERKRAEEALQESEAFLNTLLNAIPIPVFYKDRDGRYLGFNRAFETFFGAIRERLIGKTVFDINPPELAEIYHTKDTELFESGEVQPYESQVNNALGVLRDVIFNKAVFTDRQGAVSGLIGTILDITEQEREEAELRQKTALLEAQVNASLDGIIIVDKGRKILQNQQVNDLLKIPRHIAENDDDEVQVKWVKSLAKHPEEFCEKVAYMLAHPDKTMRDELEFKDGTVLDRYSSPVIGKDGKHYGRIWTFRDITERKRSEEALRSSQLQLSEAMDLAHIVYWEFDPLAETYVFNDSFYAFYGTTAEQEGGYRMAMEDYAKRFIHPDDLPLFYQIAELNAARADSESCADIEHRIIRRDGEVRHILARTRIVTDDSGCVVRVYGANQDITDRKQMEKTVQESEEKYRNFFMTSRDCVFITSPSGEWIAFNDAAVELFGYSSREELMQVKISDLYANQEERLEHISTIAACGYTKEYPVGLLRKNGTVMHTLITSASRHDKGGNVIGFQGTICDVTERKHLESQLIQARKLEAVGTLTGGIAHDFNNILMAIMGYGSLLQMKIDEGNPLRVYIDQILSGSQKAAQLTQSLLAFSRQQPIILSPLNINDIIRETEKLLKRLVIEDIAVHAVLTPDDIIVMADATQIDQILFNLATNARDAMPRGGVLTIETKAVELDDESKRYHGYGEPGRYALLSISDTGMGMDEATKAKIFDPFFTTKEVGKGTGLGLSSVYGAVKQHNGYITVYSEPNIGTTFHIYLPIVSKGAKEEESAPAPVKGGNETILVAEDNEAVRDLLRDVLVEYGYRIIEATDGADAIEKFKKTDRIDLLILDSIMPIKNGREAYDEISKIRPDIKVLFTSGYTRDVILDKGIEDKKFDFISKPISPNVLLQKVREMLDEQVLT